MKNLLKGIAVGLTALAVSTGAAMAEPLKVGFLYLGTPGDHGWTYAHEVARQKVQAHFGDKVETTFVENVPEGPDAGRITRELANTGHKIIFGTSFGFMDPMLKVSKDFPDVKFEHITGYKRSGNMATGNIRFYEGRYVQGIVAGMMTKTNKIGYIAPFPIPEAYQGLNAFAIGMREVNPDAEIMVIWANTWEDPVKEADAAKVLVAQGADVMAQHTDTPAMLQIAEKAGLHGFGQASDMKAFAPNAQLFSSVNDWSHYYIEKIQQVLDGTWSTGDGPNHWAGNTWKGIADDYLVLSPFENMPANIKAAAEKAAAKVEGGHNIFTGPIKDNKGNVVVKAGESLNDGTLWSDIFFYAEGIQGEMPG